MTDEIPNPGSDEALEQGCKCPVLDNNFGRGAYKGRDGEFIIRANCPLHGNGENQYPGSANR